MASRSRFDPRLTFDDGPGPSTPALLDVLRAASCRATFFLLGRNLASGLAVAARMAAEGHVLGNHLYTHARPGALTPAALAGEVRATDALIRQAYAMAGLAAPAAIPLRLPYGAQAEDERPAILARLGRTHVGWTAMLDDWRRPAPSPQALLQAMLDHVSSRREAVLCLHDGSRHGEARPATVEAVRRFLAGA
jgi:chitin deacetylase